MVQSDLHLRRDVNIPRLAQLLAEPGLLLHTYYYDCEVKGLNDSLLYWMEHQGITVRRGVLLNDNGRMHQKMVDTTLAVDVTRLVNNSSQRVQAIILLTGDGDFTPVLKEARANSVRVFIAHGGRTRGLSQYLTEFADGTILIDSQMCRRSHEPDRPAPPPASVLPAATRTIGPEATGPARIKAGEVVAVLAGGAATVENGGVAIAYPEATIHALKGSTTYLHAKVHLTGTSGFELIPVTEGQSDPAPSERPRVALSPGTNGGGTPKVVPLAAAERRSPDASAKVVAPAATLRTESAPPPVIRLGKGQFHRRAVVIQDWIRVFRMSETEASQLYALWRQPAWKKATKRIRRFLKEPGNEGETHLAELLNTGVPLQPQLRSLLDRRLAESRK
jgi:uncharacterized LabA/DUF88 family protein